MQEMQFQIIRHCLTLLLPEDLGISYLRAIHSSVLQELAGCRRTKAVIFDCTNLRLLDAQDLKELCQLVDCIQLMGKRVGFCSISAGLAAVLVNQNLQPSGCCFGRSLDDVISLLGS
jgi:anti-anti-sigma regulatory factor